MEAAVGLWLEKNIAFAGYSLDLTHRALLKGSKTIPLRPKTFSVLQYLVDNPHRIVSKEELKIAAWPDSKVVDAALKVSILEIRKALGDNTTAPKFIETAGRRGYRFIAPVSVALSNGTDGAASSYVVGRQKDLQFLHRHLAAADSGKRQVIFVTGEPGIGKTTLVETFANTLPASDGVLIGLGQCIEQFGSGEAYLPILDVLERLCTLPSGSEALDRLRHFAPSWLVNLPALVNPEERGELARQTLGTTPERRLREIATFFEDLSKSRTVVLALEDLHWIDPSTLALISFLARRREAARLMLIGTYREDEVERSNHPLKNIKAELQLHRYCTHLRLKLLDQPAVGEYLAARFETDTVPKMVLSTVYRRSEGNPLFMVNVTDYLLARDAIARENGSLKLVNTSERDAVPETIRDLIERQIAALSIDDQELLETASVAGTTFSVAVIARVLGRPREEVENRYRDLAKRGHYLQYAGLRIRPNGHGTPRYSFVHALYQNVIYDRIDEAKRRQLHQAIGGRTEAAYEGVTDQVVAELALHFDRAGDYDRAVKYLLAAAQMALGKTGYIEVIAHATKGLSLIKHVKMRSVVNDIELSFQLLLGVSYSNTKGFAAVHAKDAFSKARELSRRIDNDQLLFRTLFGLWLFHTVHVDLPLARDFGSDMVKVAQRNPSAVFKMIASMSVGITDFYMGHFAAARKSLEMATSLKNTKGSLTGVMICGWDPFLGVATYNAHSSWFLGYPDQAHAAIETALRVARHNSTPYDLALTYALIATYFAYIGDPQRSLEFSEATLNIAIESGFYHWAALTTIWKGSAQCKLGRITEGLELINDGVRHWRATGADKAKPVFYGFEAEAWLLAKEFARARKVLNQGLSLSKDTHDSYFDAELWRHLGDASTGSKLKEKYFGNAIALARRQKTKSLELRATMSLCRLWQKTGKEKDAKRKLAKIYGWFTEGFDTPDLKAAKELLDELG